MYDLIGRATVKAVSFYVRHHFGRQLKIGAGVAAAAVGIGAYLATRNVREG